MVIKGVIFDFNGTLFFDTQLHNQAWDIFLERYSLNLDDEEKDRKIHGKNNADILANIFKKEFSADEVQRLIIEKESIYQSLCLKQEMNLAPGAVEFFKYLQSKDIPFTIATASDLFNVEFYFKHLNLGEYFNFDKVVYNDGTMKSKPNPEIFVRAMKVLNVKPENALIFEDSSSGIGAAENSKVGKIIIVNSTNSEYSNYNHDVITSFNDIDKSIF